MKAQIRFSQIHAKEYLHLTDRVSLDRTGRQEDHIQYFHTLYGLACSELPEGGRPFWQLYLLLSVNPAMKQTLKFPLSMGASSFS